MSSVPTNTRTPFVELFVGDAKTPISTVMADAVSGSPFVGASASVFLTSLVYEITASEGNRVTMEVLDPRFDELQERIRASKDNFAFRFGWRALDDNGREDARYVSPKIGMRIASWDMDWVGGGSFGGTSLHLHGYDHSIDLALKVGSAKPAFDPSTLVSQAMKETIEAGDINGVLKHQVATTANAVGTDCSIVGNATAAQFLERLRRIAKPAAGTGSYDIRSEPIEEGKKTLIVCEPRGIRRQSSRKYVFGRSQTGEVLSFVPQYHNLWPIGHGGHRLQALYWDATSKTPKAVISDRLDDPAVAPRYDRPYTTVARAIETPLAAEAAVQSDADDRRRGADGNTQRATLSVMGDVGIKVLDTVEVLVLKGTHVSDIKEGSLVEIQREASGFFTIYSATHQVSAGKFTTTMMLGRTGGYSGSQPTLFLPPKSADTGGAPGAVSKIVRGFDPR